MVPKPQLLPSTTTSLAQDVAARMKEMASSEPGNSAGAAEASQPTSPVDEAVANTDADRSPCSNARLEQEASISKSPAAAEELPDAESASAEPEDAIAAAAAPLRRSRRGPSTKLAIILISVVLLAIAAELWIMSMPQVPLLIDKLYFAVALAFQLMMVLASLPLPEQGLCCIKGASSGLPQVHIGFVRRRPMHPERFFALVRRRFGPLDSDLSCNYGSVLKPLGEVRVLSGSGCLWFIGSDDMRGEWLFSSSAGRHLLRCGEPWPAEAGATETEAGSRRVDLSLEVSGTPADVDAWKASCFSELNDCLITRAEAVALEEGDTSMLSPQCEWEEMRAVQENLSPWVVHWWPLLRLLHGITTMVTAIPGFGLLQTVGRSLATRVRTGAWARIF
eukprot:s101_g38.t1